MPAGHGDRGRGRGGGGLRAPLPRDVQISKKLSKLLRHNAEKEGLHLDARGFINVQEVLNSRDCRSLKVTFDEIRQIVAESEKQRFSMVSVHDSSSSSSALRGQEDGASGSGTSEENHVIRAVQQPPLPSDDPKDYLIRANQGHSLKLESDGLLQPITADNIPETAVHGTTHAAWVQILASGGLKPMKRNHVHFASGLPAGFTSIGDEENVDGKLAAAPVISGMRQSSTVLVWLDVKKAMDAGLVFWRSENGVVLTEGRRDGKDGEGLVVLEFFKRVEDRTGEGVLVVDGKVVKVAPREWGGGIGKGKARG